jgi:invasion protein IalB
MIEDTPMKHVLVLFLMIAMRLAFSASAIEAAGDPTVPPLTYEPWAKVCVNRADGNSDCFISSGARGACQPSGGGVAIVIRDKKQTSLSANLVTRRKLDGTLSVRIDQGAPIQIPHTDCHESGCRGKLDVEAEFVEALKHSRTISIEAATVDHQTVSLAFSLADFAKAYDGPAGEPAKAKEMTSEELKERAQRIEKPVRCEE